MVRPFPTLDLIDRALHDPARGLSQAANAAALERRARELASEYWSELAWLTGAVRGPALDRVAAELQAMRIGAAGSAATGDPAGQSAATEGREPDVAERAA